ncbi:MAG: radical SAM protein [Bacteroidetes bacterium]|nr:MAG: radical SAM protein [Bacteroidota bacterium]
MKQPYLKGRGAQINPPNRFHNLVYDEGTQHLLAEDSSQVPTKYIEVYPKTIINKVESPDLPFNYSMNPYQGCEHGCVYCYARNTHQFWGYSAGLEFEQTILYKKNAPQLLEKKLKSPRWKAEPIMLSGNTDCYQPAENKLQITRALLKVLLKYRHPVGIITKNSLILRDLDILQELNKYDLVKTVITVTTLDDKLRQFLEPRASSMASRFKTIQALSNADIPVTAMISPMIPGLNEHELIPLAKKVSTVGADNIFYSLVRLNGEIGRIFEDWLSKNYPDRKDKVLSKIRSCHSGELGDSRFGKRMSGEGNIAQIIKDQYKLAKKIYFKDAISRPYNLELHEQFKTGQLKLF